MADAIENIDNILVNYSNTILTYSIDDYSTGVVQEVQLANVKNPEKENNDSIVAKKFDSVFFLAIISEF